MKKPVPDNKVPTHVNGGEGLLYERLRDLIQCARSSIARGIDLIQVRTNFEIGRHIVEFEQQGRQLAAYGKVVLTQLATRLALEFGTGFSLTSLKLMRQFYLLKAERIGQTLSDLLQPQQRLHLAASPSFVLGWSHHVLLMWAGRAT